MKRLLFIFCVLTVLSKAQTCGNLNVETGNLSGWTLTNGFNTNTSTMAGCCSTPGSSVAIVVSTPLTAGYFGVLPHSPYGGTKILQIGDSALNIYATKATYSFVVTGNTFQYAVASIALNPANHICSSQSYNAVVLKNNTGTIFYTNQMVPATNTGTCTAGGSVFTNTVSNNNTYGCWSTFSVNIGAYISQNISVEVSAVNCTGAGHWIYCYFDGVCTAVTPTIMACGLTTGIKESSSNNSNISVWPNPAKDNVNISLNATNDTELFIYDLVGKLVMYKKDLQNENSISIRNLNQGLYFYNIVENNRSIKTGKIIKE